MMFPCVVVSTFERTANLLAAAEGRGHKRDAAESPGPERSIPGGNGTKTIGRSSLYGRASETGSEARLSLRGIGSRLRVGLQRPANSEAGEIALHLGRRFNPRL